MSTFRIQDVDPAVLHGERVRLLALLRGLAPEAEVIEVGSTAVRGVIGKGDLDFLVRVPSEGFAALRGRLDGVLRRNAEQLSIDTYQGYHLDSPLDAAVQFTVTGGAHDDFEPFLEALRADSELVASYNALKRRFDGQPMDAYRQAKSHFIEGVLSARR